jgi:hypothetical protein
MEFIYLYQIADTVFVKGSCTSLTSLEKRIKNDYPKQRYKIYPVYSFHHSMSDLKSWFQHRICKDKEDKTTKFVLKIKSLSFDAVSKKCMEISVNDRHNPNKKPKNDDDDTKNDDNDMEDDIYKFTDDDTKDNANFERLDKNSKKRKYIHVDDEDEEYTVEDDIESEEDKSNIEENKNDIEEDIESEEDKSNIEENKNDIEESEEDKNNIEEIMSDDESEKSESDNVKFLKQRTKDGVLQILVSSDSSEISETDFQNYKNQGYVAGYYYKITQDFLKVYWLDSWIDADYLDFDPKTLKKLPKA